MAPLTVSKLFVQQRCAFSEQFQAGQQAERVQRVDLDWTGRHIQVFLNSDGACQEHE